MNPFLATDGYKGGHHKMYPEGTTLVYSNLTPRSNKYAPKGCDKVASFGQQMVMKQIDDMFHAYFFNCTKNSVCQEIKKEYSLYLGEDYSISHIEALWDLGYLPIEVKVLEEGTLVPMGVPVLTIVNTKPEFFWLTNFLETLISNLLWKPMTSATIGYQFKKLNDEWIEKTDKGNEVHRMFGCHDFSMRGMDSIDATISSGLGHAVSFMGSDSLPVIHGARKYYGNFEQRNEGIIHSVNATEHSVMCAGTKGDEIGTFKYLMKQFPKGILSIVSDTWDLWKVLTKYLPKLKDEILARDGKIVIRPDSGDPVDIICGESVYKIESTEQVDMELELQKFAIENVKTLFTSIEDERGWTSILVYNGENYFDVDLTYLENYNEVEISSWAESNMMPDQKGVVELLWDVFGGTVNEQGYKVLNPKIGAIYGDSINLERFQQINERLEAKGFASTNWVAGIGSFTYQFNTRDTFGFAMKATYCEVMTNIDGGNNEGSFVPIGREIFKDPITDDGTKKSAKGLLMVQSSMIEKDNLELFDQVDWKSEKIGLLKTIFKDGKFYNQTTLTEIRSKLK